jgi:hypothetical protein
LHIFFLPFVGNTNHQTPAAQLPVFKRFFGRTMGIECHLFVTDFGKTLSKNPCTFFFSEQSVGQELQYPGLFCNFLKPDGTGRGKGNLILLSSVSRFFFCRFWEMLLVWEAGDMRRHIPATLLAVL